MVGDKVVHYTFLKNVPILVSEVAQPEPVAQGLHKPQSYFKMSLLETEIVHLVVQFLMQEAM